jgi:uncharacterized DUF497 family protein
VTFNWNEEKNELRKKNRGISFEEIVVCINEGKILEVLEHPNKDKYPNQFIYAIEYKDYVYAVPFAKDEKTEEIFLKTIYPSRTYTRKYLKRG